MLLEVNVFVSKVSSDLKRLLSLYLLTFACLLTVLTISNITDTQEFGSTNVNDSAEQIDTSNSVCGNGVIEAGERCESDRDCGNVSTFKCCQPNDYSDGCDTASEFDKEVRVLPPALPNQ